MARIQTSSRRPYFIRAMHEWMSDNGETPHIVVDCDNGQVDVPEQYIRDGRIVLNLSYSAAAGLTIGNEQISFDARFGGASRHIAIPVTSVLGIYSRESGEGMLFGDDDPASSIAEPATDDVSSNKNGAKKKSHLKVIK